MRSYKYTKEQLSPIVASSFSIAEVGKKLGLTPSGGTNANLKKLFKLFEIDNSHFKGQGASFGDRKKGGPKKQTWEEILVIKDNGRREDAVRLRRAMLEYGFVYKCAICGQQPVWNGKELRLHVDHINGNYLNSSPENVRFVCPNCHTQTPTYCMNKGLTDLTSHSRWHKDYRRKAQCGRGVTVATPVSKTGP